MGKNDTSHNSDDMKDPETQSSTHPNNSKNSSSTSSSSSSSTIINSTANSSSAPSCSASTPLSFCNGLIKTPLAVPMVADTNQSSVTRHDAKAITHSRLKRLKELSQKPETALSKDQKDEKKRIIRLEKNRRAAAMSRRKKKMYVKNLEERAAIMAKHLAILEMENSHLRAMLSATTHSSHAHSVAPHPMQLGPMGNTAHFKLPFPSLPLTATTNINSQFAAHLVEPSNSENGNNAMSNNEVQTIREASNQPAAKKRRLNDRSSQNISTRSPSADGSSEVCALEPLPLPTSMSESNNNNNNSNNNSDTADSSARGESIQRTESEQTSAIPTKFPALPFAPFSQRHVVPPHLLPYVATMPPIVSHPVMNNPHMNLGRVEGILIDNEGQMNHNNNQSADTANNRSQSVEVNEGTQNNNNCFIDDSTNGLPPNIEEHCNLSVQFNTMLDGDDILDESIDEYGSVNQFQNEIQRNNNVVYM